MQKIGDVCSNCEGRWEAKKKEPMVLQRLGGTTINKKMVVAACPYCDGAALEISAQGNHE